MIGGSAALISPLVPDLAKVVGHRVQEQPDRGQYGNPPDKPRDLPVHPRADNSGLLNPLASHGPLPMSIAPGHTRRGCELDGRCHGRRTPPSRSRSRARRTLQRRQEATRLRGSSRDPPAETGTTWSTWFARPPHQRQRQRSRSRILRRTFGQAPRSRAPSSSGVSASPRGRPRPLTPGGLTAEGGDAVLAPVEFPPHLAEPRLHAWCLVETDLVHGFVPGWGITA